MGQAAARLFVLGVCMAAGPSSCWRFAPGRRVDLGQGHGRVRLCLPLYMCGPMRTLRTIGWSLCAGHGVLQRSLLVSLFALQGRGGDMRWDLGGCFWLWHPFGKAPVQGALHSGAETLMARCA